MTKMPLLVTALIVFLTACGTAPEPTSVTGNTAVPPTATEVPFPEQELGDKMTRPKDGMVMLYIPPGHFTMGSTDAQVDEAVSLCNELLGGCERAWFANEQPAHTVVLDAFWIDQTEVANAHYLQCVQDGACRAQGCRYSSEPSSPEHPVVCVNWDQARAYCEWAGGRLPTEAEWEYAARGPEARVYPWGNEFNEGLWKGECSTSPRPHPVASCSLDTSWCGALDMAGNVGEWVADRYDPEYYSRSPSENPQGPDDGDQRVSRTDSFGRLASRGGYDDWGFDNFSGFRCAVSARP